MAFLETPRFPEQILYGSSGGPAYKTDVVIIDSGYEQRNQKWSYPRYTFDANLIKFEEDLEDLISFFHVAAGKANGFRFKDSYDFKSCVLANTIAYTDQSIASGDGATTTFQLLKAYTQGATTQYRKITKPVSGTVLAGVSNPTSGNVQNGSGWSVDTTTGIITWQDTTATVTNAVDQGGGITRITASGHGLSLTDDETVYLSAFTGDWSALNGRRFVANYIANNIIEINHDSSSYAAYSSNGGQTDTLPQTGETVLAGFEFDVPVRFDTDTLSTSFEAYQMGAVSVPLVELRI